MRVYHSLGELPQDFGPSAVAIGKFDGVHSGHQALIDRLTAHAAAHGVAAVIVTFDRNPLALLAPELCPDELVGTAQKARLLAQNGVDAVVVLTFDEARAEQTADEFIRDVLVQALHAEHVLVGEDFRFGHGGEGTPEGLCERGLTLGFTVDVLPDVFQVGGGRRVSSSWVRELLSAGAVDVARTLLGRAHTIRGEVVHGLKRGRALGFPTANLAFDADGFVPGDGVYAGWLLVNNEEEPTRYPAAISVGTNPTFDDVERRQVEAYVLDETDLDLYGRVVDVQFIARIRGMLAFDGIEPLIARMHEDVAAVRARLATEL